MANELKDAVDQLKAHAAAISNVQRAMLGQPLTALPEAMHNKPVACVYLRTGRQVAETYTGAWGEHVVDLRFYWLLTPVNQEVVEQSVATFIDAIAAKYDADINLSGLATVALLTGADGEYNYTVGYEIIEGKLHRVLTVPMMVVQRTHSLIS